MDRYARKERATIERVDEGLVRPEKEKGPDKSDPFSLMLAERTGLAHVPRAADSLARESLRAQNVLFAGRELLRGKRKKARQVGPFLFDAGGADGARTRDPRRDRPVF